MNAVATLLLATYLGTVLYQGNGAELWSAVKTDGPQFIPWLIALLVLVLVWQSRGALGPARSTLAAVIVGGVLAVVILSSSAFSTAIRDIGALLTKGA